MTESDDDVEYCAKCGYAEFNEDGTESHADDEEYDHDFEPEEEESNLLEDIKDLADTVKSVADAGVAVKKLTEEHPELTANRFKIEPPKFKMPDFELAPHPDVKVERRHKENIKWIKIGIVAGAVVTIILGTVAIFFNYIFS